MRLRRAARVILIGAPGVGKGTQSERLLRRFPELASISSGDLLRSNVKLRTPLGIQVESTMKAGGLVPDDTILRLISNELSQRGWLFSGCAGGVQKAGVTTLSSPGASHLDDNSADSRASFLLDGFPRTAGQAEQLDEIVPINLAVSLKTPLEAIVERISSRWVHEPSGRVYNTTFNAPRVAGRDDVTGEPLVRRSDDSADVYRARFAKFTETSEPLLEHYARKGVLWEVEGLSSDEISPKLFREFERRFVD